MTGRTDVPLSPEGHAQALEAGRSLAGLHVDRVWCSPLTRARETAALVAEGHGALPAPEVRDELPEVDFGEFEGHSDASADAAGIGEAFRRWRALDGGPDAPGGEGMVEAAARARRAIAGPWSGTALVVAHGTLLRCLVADLIGLGAERHRRLTHDPCHAMVLLGRELQEMRLVGANLPAEAVAGVLGAS